MNGRARGAWPGARGVPPDAAGHGAGGGRRCCARATGIPIGGPANCARGYSARRRTGRGRVGTRSIRCSCGPGGSASGAAAGGLAPPPHLRVPTAPNAVWTVDFKGEFRTGRAACAMLDLTRRIQSVCPAVTALPSVRGEHTTRSWPGRLRRMGCRSGFGVITGHRLGVRAVLPAYPGSPCGGSGSACGRSASPPAGRGKTGRTSSFIGC